MKIDIVGQKLIPLKDQDKGSVNVAGTKGKADPELWKASKQFEGLFMSQLIKAMQKTLPDNSLAGKGMSEMMFDRVMGEALTENGGIGLADILYRNMLAKDAPNTTDNESMDKQVNAIRPVSRKDNNVNISE